MEPHSAPAQPPPAYQLDWETPTSHPPRRSRISQLLHPTTTPRHQHPTAAKEAHLLPVASPTHTANAPHAAPAVHRRSPLDSILPPNRRYLHLRRRTFLLVLLAILLLILILGLGLGFGLRRKSSSASLPFPDDGSTLHTGELTYYAPGLGACGITSSEADDIVAVSHELFDAAAEKAGTGANPNANPLCGRKIRIEGLESREVTVVDRCTGCKPADLDVTQMVFERMAEVERGRVEVRWRWV